MPENNRERDLVLAPNESAFVLDRTKGHVMVYVGPNKTSLAGTDQLVLFDPRSKQFFPAEDIRGAKATSTIAPEGWYIVLKNPADSNKHPEEGKSSNLVGLTVGKKVNIPGPVSFALWPGQMVKVVQGHYLRSNQYLKIRVYDEEEAQNNWSEAIIKTQDEGEEGKKAESKELSIKPADLTMGKTLIVKGTEFSFFIPPTGIEVVSNSRGEYIRQAVSLERLEYCVLLDESGDKTFKEGPAVVFPKPTETFLAADDGGMKFRAIELNELQGLYVKVIAPYTEEKDGKPKQYNVGDEIFITGKDQMIYFPREEHAIIKYGGEQIHYAIAIPEGDTRYVLDRNSGKVELVSGPKMFLPDPRTQVMVRRVLSPRECDLWFPGNNEALEYNAELDRMNDTHHDLVADSAIRGLKTKKRMEYYDNSTDGLTKSLSEGVGDDFKRKTSFTKPRTITLDDSKFEGGVTIDIWTGYAVVVKSKTGDRKVVVGPKTVFLEYDETLEVMELSTGTPKSTNRLQKTVYLRVLNNTVSDTIKAETKDLCKVGITLSYRVNFTGDGENWFNVENYVKFLTDHLRSLVRGVVKQRGIEEFYAEYTTILRDAILGVQNGENGRKGREFVENSMIINDVEILDVYIDDPDIADALITNQQDVVRKTLDIGMRKREVELVKEEEALQRIEHQEQSDTHIASLKLRAAEQKKETELAETRKIKVQADMDVSDVTHKTEIIRLAEKHDLKIKQLKDQLKVQDDSAKEKSKNLIAEINAVKGELAEAITFMADRDLSEKLAEHMSPLAMLGGNSVLDVFTKLTRGVLPKDGNA